MSKKMPILDASLGFFTVATPRKPRCLRYKLLCGTGPTSGWVWQLSVLPSSVDLRMMAGGPAGPATPLRDIRVYKAFIKEIQWYPMVHTAFGGTCFV